MELPNNISLGWAIVASIFIFVRGQIIVKFIIEPIHNYRKIVGRITNSLIYFSNVGPSMEYQYVNRLEKINKELRKIRGHFYIGFTEKSETQLKFEKEQLENSIRKNREGVSEAKTRTDMENQIIKILKIDILKERNKSFQLKQIDK